MATYPSCGEHHRLTHPVPALEGPLAELLRAAHRLGVPLVVWSGSWSGTSTTAPGRLLSHTHVCPDCDPQLSGFIRAIEETVIAALINNGAHPFIQS